MLDWINAHGLLMLGAFWVFSSAVGAMPNPSTASSSFYQWFYKFSHDLLQFVAANGSRLPFVRNLLGITGGPTIPPSSQG